MGNSETHSLAAVSYLNTKPLLYGLLHGPLAQCLRLELDYPAGCARRLLEGSVDMALIPTGVIPQCPSAQVFSNFCIGSRNRVKTVGIFAHQPLENLTAISLDPHSRTSVLLLKILLKEYWNLPIRLVEAGADHDMEIAMECGALIIGDQTMGLHEKYPFFYDLGEAWRSHTGLPFVFAAWVSRKELNPTFVKAFNESMELGLDAIPELLLLLPKVEADFDLAAYFRNHIHYHLDEQMLEGMQLFWEKIRQL